MEALRIGEARGAGLEELTPPDFATQAELRSMALEIPAILQLLKRHESIETGSPHKTLPAELQELFPLDLQR